MPEDPPSPARIVQLGGAFMASKALLSAVELGLFTALAEHGPQNAEALRRRLGLHGRGAPDFFDALVALGVLARGEDGRYANAPDADLFLDRRKETYVGGWLEMFNARLYGFWGALTEALRTGEPQNESKGGGEDLFGPLYADPARLEAFLRAMSGASLPVARALAERFPWGRYRTFIDIGCAQGCLPVQVAKAHPHLTGGGFDLPQVRPVFESYVAERGLADRLRFHAGDFFADPLPAADVLVMGHVLHDWDLATKRTLLAKAHAVLPEGGALVVYELLIDDARRINAAGLLMSLNMLIETRGGFDYTGADCAGWMREAGFRESRVEPLTEIQSMVVGTK
jgi:hypothetical protein